MPLSWRPRWWTTKSTAKLAGELTAQGHEVSPDTGGKLLKGHGYSLQGNSKTIEGKQHPDRDAQFHYLNDQVGVFLAAGLPVISVDTKKKELVGAYRNGGREYQPTGSPVATNTYDFVGEAGKAVPYGVYDVGANTGWVNVGTDADTGEFAVESIRRWWNHIGSLAYPGARKLLITADGGGSNGSRLRLWKTQLAELATQTDLQITVSHLPPGTPTLVASHAAMTGASSHIATTRTSEPSWTPWTLEVRAGQHRWRPASYRTIKGVLDAGAETPRPRDRPGTPGRTRTYTAPTSYPVRSPGGAVRRRMHPCPLI